MTETPSSSPWPRQLPLFDADDEAEPEHLYCDGWMMDEKQRAFWSLRWERGIEVIAYL